MGRPLGGKNKKYSVKEKMSILNEHYESGLGWKQLCKLYNLSSSLVYSWDKKYQEFGIKGLENNNKHNNPNFGKHNRFPTEVEQLKDELLKKEIEIMRLKKGYVVKGVGVKKEYVSLLDVNIK